MSFFYVQNHTLSLTIKSKKYLFGFLFVFIFPVLYCHKFVLNDFDFSLRIGNDFGMLYYNYKVFLLDYLSNFRIPLWSPSEGAGFPFYSNPFTQTFYPLNIPLALIYKINGGYSYSDHQIFSVLGLSIFATGLLAWLRLLKVNFGCAVFTAAIISVSFKITEILRFPNAVHTAAWIPFVLFGITLALDCNKKFISSLIIFVSLILMFTAGYPYYIYYSAFLFLPYFLLTAFLINKKICFAGINFDLKKFFFTVGLSFISAIAICFPYLIKVKDLMEQTSLRKGDDFSYSTFIKFNFIDTIGSLIFPPASQFEGWYYFGMIALMLIIFMLVFVIFNFSKYKNLFLLSAIILVWYLIISYITYGEDSYLFKFFWNYLPGFSSLRAWGRMNIVLLPAFAYLIAVSAGLFLNLLVKNNKQYSKDHKLVPVLVSFTIICFIILYLQFYFYVNNIFDDYWNLFFKNKFKSFDERFFISAGVVSFTILISFLFLSRFVPSKNKKIFPAIFLTVIFIVNAFDLYPAGSLQWADLIKPDSQRKILDAGRSDKLSFQYGRINNSGTVSLDQFQSVGIIEDWYFSRYQNFYKTNTSDTSESSNLDFQKIMGINNGKRIFFTKNINYENISDFLSDAGSFETQNISSFAIEKYNGDELECIVDSREIGFCSFIDNWDSDWNVKVNDLDENIELLFGTFKSVKIKKGKNAITFQYKPKIF